MGRCKGARKIMMMAEELLLHIGLRRRERCYQNLGELGAVRLRNRATAKAMVPYKG